MQKSLGLIETQGLAGGITAADAAVKSANVELIGYELTKGGGWTTVKIQGDVGAVKAAVDAAKIAAGKVCRVVSTRVIPRPATALEMLVENGDTVGYEPPEPDPPAPPEPPVPPEPSPSPDESKEDAAPPVEEAPEPEAEALMETESEAEIPAEAEPEADAPAETEPEASEAELELEPKAETPAEEQAVEPAPEEGDDAGESVPAPAPVRPKQQAKKGPAKRGQGGKRKQ